MREKAKKIRVYTNIRSSLWKPLESL